MRSFEEVRRELTGPGGVFEVQREDVQGCQVLNFKHRMKSLREISRMNMLRSDNDVFLVYGDREIGFKEFSELSSKISEYFLNLGVKKGDRIAILSANNPEWCLTFWACVQMGAILVGLNGWWKADEIIYGLNHSGSKILVADIDRFKRIEDKIDQLESVEHIYVIGSAGAGHEDFSSLIEHSGSESWLTITIEEDDPAVIFYTSGTTGRPKGAVSTHRSMIANLQNTQYHAIASSMENASEGLLPDLSVQLCSLLTSPLFHVSGCHSGLVVGYASGIKLVIPEGKLEPEKILRLIEKHKISLWTGVPTVVWRVVEEAHKYNYDTSSLRSVAYGGSPSSKDLQEKVKSVFKNVKSMGNAYGLTETSSVATINYGEGLKKYPESVGRPLPTVEIAIFSESGDILPDGEIGEIGVKGPIVMPGYWNDAEATAAIKKDCWLMTGDVGYVNSEGFLFITDRSKDMIIRGGENVYCVEIENRLNDHPLIAESAVIGVPHPTLGEEVKAIVHLEPGATMTAEEVKAWVRQALADFKVPQYVEFTNDFLPRNPSGKLLKNLLRNSGEVSFDEAELG